MKDLLKDFKIQSVLRQLSPQTIDLLVERFCNEPKPDLKSIRKDKKKRDVLQAITEAVSDHSHCVRKAFVRSKITGIFVEIAGDG